MARRKGFRMSVSYALLCQREEDARQNASFDALYAADRDGKFAEFRQLIDAHRDAEAAAAAAGVPEKQRLRPVSTAPLPRPIQGPERNTIAMTPRGGLYRQPDSDRPPSEFENTPRGNFEVEVEKTFQKVCREECGDWETPEETAKRTIKEGHLRAQGRTVCEALESQGIDGFRADSKTDVYSLDVHEGELDRQPDFRRICLNPWIAHRLRLPILSWVEYFLQQLPNKRAVRFFTFTNGPRCRVEALEKRLSDLHRDISKLNAAPFMVEAGVVIILRSTELGSLEKKRTRGGRMTAEELGGDLGRDASGAVWYHPHAHCLAHFTKGKICDPDDPKNREPWNKFLRDMAEHWQHMWDEGGMIRDAREAVKYVSKPGDMVKLAKENPAELAKLHAVLFRKKLLQPMGTLRDMIRTNKEAGMVVSLAWHDDGKKEKRVWKLSVNHNQNRFACGSEKVIGDATRAEYYAAKIAQHYGPAPTDDVPFVRVVARIAPSYNGRGVKSPRVVIIASRGLPASEIVAEAMRHPLVQRLKFGTAEAYARGLACAQAHRAGASAIRVHTATPTVQAKPPRPGRNLGAAIQKARARHEALERAEKLTLCIARKSKTTTYKPSPRSTTIPARSASASVAFPSSRFLTASTAPPSNIRSNAGPSAASSLSCASLVAPAIFAPKSAPLSPPICPAPGRVRPPFPHKWLNRPGLTFQPMKKTLIAAAALIGMAGASVQQSPARVAAQTANASKISAAQPDAKRDAQTPAAATASNEIRADAFGGGFDIGGALLRERAGHSPKDWGMSRACARMVRKNRMIRAGIKTAKI